jgi:preprotein translocase subunit SecA
MLYTNDTLWMEHLEAMDYLRSSVNLRAYGQREPIVEYKREGLQMFKEMEEVFKDQVLSLIETINVEEASKSATQKEEIKQTQFNTSHTEVNEFADTGEAKIGRNDPCPCGSGKKYKKCHGK